MYNTKNKRWIVSISTLIATLVVAIFLLDKKSTSSYETTVIVDKLKDSKPLEIENNPKDSKPIDIQNNPKDSLELALQELEEIRRANVIAGPINLSDKDKIEFQRIVTESQLRLLEIEFKNIEISSPSENKYIISISRIPDEERDMLLANLEAELLLLDSVQKGDANIERLMFSADKHFRRHLATKNFGEFDRKIVLTIIPAEKAGRDPSFDYSVEYEGVARKGNYLVPNDDLPLFLAPYVQAILNQNDA